MAEALKKVEAFLKKQGLVASHRTLSNMHDLLFALSEDAGDTYIDFDTECIYDRQNYQNLLAGFKRTCGDGNQFEILSVYFDTDAERAGIWIRVNGREFKGDWSQTSDWVSNEFLEIVDEFEKVLKGRFVRWFIDQDFRAFYIEDEAVAKEMTDLFEKLLSEEKW